MVWRSAMWVQGLLDDEQKKDSKKSQSSSGLTGDLKVDKDSKSSEKPATSDSTKASGSSSSKKVSEVEMTSMKK
ncbi:hypothetical protein FOL47_008195 [Perkinsus chesapeaki]|uniref:Uncharacterized protein n=1 Tax=Perkinsus chesapeaki TaxID=330153 RepID=A0A7J6LFK6_PERCH|nr:hypothetical protein FOL47_008195 [Perkinsus chesapeaki]